MAISNTPDEKILEIREKQSAFFKTGVTLDISFRKRQLQKFQSALRKWEKPLSEALWTDLHKSYEEAYMTELSIVLSEVKNHLRHLSSWAKPQHKCTPLKMFPSSSKIISEPLGTALIIAPWNYPVQLLLNPLVGAISAGCTAVLKPSPYVPSVSKVIGDMVKESFDEQYIAVVQGNRVVNQSLLARRWDLIFFTGSPDLGKKVMSAAASNLTPVVLELGGKSPCIVDKDTNLKTAARRVAWGKLLNAGQTCIAPDYLLVHEDIKAAFLKELEAQFSFLLGDRPKEAKHFVRIVNDRAFERITGYFSDGKIIYGGDTDRSERYIEPTILDNVSPESSVMKEEIFGPVFPVIGFKALDEALDFVVGREKPLALYYFGKNGDKVLRHTSSGGACVNDTIMHIANDRIPFGGVGNSGMSSYHGKLSFVAFSHLRAVVTTPAWLDIPFRYMPYTLFKFFKGLL